MPELPEVETVMRGLSCKLPGCCVKTVEVLRTDSIAYPEPAQFAKRLQGHRFVQLRRRGKYLLMKLDGDAGLGVHLRMSGRLIYQNEPAEAGKHLRVRIHLDSGGMLDFEDMRVFGRLWYVPAGRSFEDVISGLLKLGIEPLEELTGAYLAGKFQGRSLSIKAALMDQSILAGLGNIYADESLFAAGVNPATAVCDLKKSQLDRIAGKVKEVLKQAIDLGGTTIRDYADSSGINGNYQGQACVYGRSGERCRKCSAVIERIKLVGRSTHYCPCCQPA